jgi:hypothetical protein
MAKGVKRRSKQVQFDGAGEYKLDPETLVLLDTLRDATEWDHETLVDYLSAPAADPTSGVDAESTHDWKALLTAVAEAAAVVDTVWDKRHVVTEFSPLLRLVGEDERVREAAARLAQTVHEREDDDLSPFEYIELGEIDAASELVAARFGEGSLAPTSPYRSEPVVHLSEARILLYLDGERELLGRNVYPRIESHLATCDVCWEAVAFCASDRGTATGNPPERPASAT